MSSLSSLSVYEKLEKYKTFDVSTKLMLAHFACTLLKVITNNISVNNILVNKEFNVPIMNECSV